MPLAQFDLIVIGSGPAGQKAALNAAKLGKSIAVVERFEDLGGVCIHTGTIPSKAMREAVLHLTGLNERELYGSSYRVKQEITMSDLLYRCHHVVRTEAGVIRNQMHRNGVHVLSGTASFLDPHTLHIEHGADATEARANYILVAVGTVPSRPADVPFTPEKVIDSDELLTLKKLPRSIIIVGGGVIGTEYACMMAAVGTRVTLVESRPRLLEFLDDEIAENLQFRMRDMGIRLKLGESVSKIALEDGVVHATLASGKRIAAESLLYSIGRRGATDQLNLGVTGLKTDARGRLQINEFCQTAVPHIYAAGDVVGYPALASTSMEQGRLASVHMFQKAQDGQTPSVSDAGGGGPGAAQAIFPYGIFSIPEISMVGQTEQALTRQNIPYEVGIARYREIARGQLIADPHGLLKLLFHPDSRRLLGVHAIGTGATELIHIGQAVIAAGMPIDYFIESVFNYPTLAECYKVAALDGINRIRLVGNVGEKKPVPAVVLQAKAA
jgi:NAD(P) transhydrogenase